LASPDHLDLQPRRREGAERLARRAAQLDRQVVGLQLVAHPEALDDVARHPRADRPQRVLHRVAQLHLLAVLEERLGVLHDLRVERVGHLVARLARS
jgi:hypothetical protein